MPDFVRRTCITTVLGMLIPKAAELIRFFTFV